MAGRRRHACNVGIDQLIAIGGEVLPAQAKKVNRDGKNQQRKPSQGR